MRVDGTLKTVRGADWADDGAIELFVLDAGEPRRILLSEQRLASGLVPINDRGGDPARALTALWGCGRQHAVPRIRSAVLATRPLRPYAHQNDAVHGHMLSQPRPRFLLGDIDPGTLITQRPADVLDRIQPEVGQSRGGALLHTRWRAADMAKQ
ncbi:hypothetical protein [Frankia sp. ACN1ag]|uniref:hypothetical protein n=1 Tax=Frankia sp. ACN1ag TaxID=102891 RepID=UPI00128F32A1|nr:hypothetical protein [Frankia sp. ACN1ag]